MLLNKRNTSEKKTRCQKGSPRVGRCGDQPAYTLQCSPCTNIHKYQSDVKFECMFISQAMPPGRKVPRPCVRAFCSYHLVLLRLTLLDFCWFYELLTLMNVKIKFRDAWCVIYSQYRTAPEIYYTKLNAAKIFTVNCTEIK